LSTGDSGKPKFSWAQVAGAKAKEPATVAATPASLPPPPSALPKASPKPPAVAVAKGAAKCPTPSPQERGYPLGFENREEFAVAMAELESILADEGIEATAIGVRGSSVTFTSNNPNKPGSYFDKRGTGKSDIDVFFVTDGYLACRPSRKGIFHDSEVAEHYPAIAAWNSKWSARLDPKRKVAAAGFRPGASMKPSPADSILFSGGL
jgi:hypothetical protein